MTKKEYFSKLEHELSQAKISKVEKEEILSEIEERFEVARDKNETLSQVMKKLGTPKELAKSYLGNLGLEAEIESSSGNVKKPRQTWQSVFIALILIGFNLFFGIWVLMSIFGMILACIAGAGAAMLAGMVLAAVPFLTSLIPVSMPDIPMPVTIMAGLTITFLALSATLLLVQILIWALKLTVKYFQLNIKLIKG